MSAIDVSEHLSAALSSVYSQMDKPISGLYNEPAGVYEEFLRSQNQECEEIQTEFNELVRLWKHARSAASSSTVIAMHPAYQRIIGMGKPALPLILRELSHQLDHWFWALKAISGDDPIPMEHRGKMKQMAADWLRWGHEKGYVR
jgi:hypothetical protein